MKINEFKEKLAGKPEACVRFVLPDGTRVPAHAHVTEAARIDKRFVDCGGTFREESMCRLQTWVANDVEHRLIAGKLLKILEKAKPVLISDDLEVDVEHEVQYISQFPVGEVTMDGAEVVVKLAERHTACLAIDQCCPPPREIGGFPTLNFPMPRNLLKPLKEQAGKCCE